MADGFSTYYNVEIFLTGYNVPVISTQVDGYGDTIDVSSLTDNDYDIVITSEFNNRFVGQFTVEWKWSKNPDEMGFFWQWYRSWPIGGINRPAGGKLYKLNLKFL